MVERCSETILKSKDRSMALTKKELIDNLAKKPHEDDVGGEKRESVLKTMETDGGVVKSRGIVGLTQRGGHNAVVLCPERNYELRSSSLCESCCAYQFWSDSHANKVREQCPIWSELKDKDLVNG